MRINIIAVNSDSIPRSIRRCRTYRNLVGQVLNNSPLTTDQLDDRIIEEQEEDMEDAPDQPSESTSHRMIQTEKTNNIMWHNDSLEESIDKEDDDEDDDDEEEDPTFEGDNNLTRENNQSSFLDPPEIKVTMDDSLLQKAHEYRVNFDGFAQINRFNSIEELHDFIKNTMKISENSNNNCSEDNSNRQELYLSILLNERPEDRFKKLFDESRLTVRRLLTRNEHILRKLFASASLEIFPSPLARVEETAEAADEDVVCSDLQDDEVDENMKRWYMIEMIGLWLKMITDVTSYREAIKRRVLMNSWGIEDNQYEGIVVPLEYK
ncbi:GSCOCG00007928001-RA-CDS [Cotesia congregata]|uniref:Uncharacterized protein n=1 Tax=Cotesia congregata TaxID=51543 RepID=A0A8J2HI67_COTCN|nr:GSCOCG00007928001-RA-CDS [Cotesia congregata]CAG5100803.1 Protein of unknown function [Cotesia congregata]